MHIASKLTSIGIIALSIAVGLISFYLTSDLSKEKKKHQMEEVVSHVINFIVFIWFAKVILNFSIFVQDPLAVLAHPSTSHAFYLATLFTTIHLFYKYLRRKINILLFLKSFLHVFLTASFFYEFIQYISGSNTYAFGYLILLALLLVLLFTLRERVVTTMLLLILLAGWSGGVFTLIVIQPFVTVFGYTMSSWFVGLFFVINFFIIIYKRKWGSS